MASRACSQVYHGLAPFSENETRAIRVELWEIELFSELRPFLQDTLLPRQGNISVYLSAVSWADPMPLTFASVSATAGVIATHPHHFGVVHILLQVASKIANLQK